MLKELRENATIPDDFDIIKGTTAVKGRWFCIEAVGDNVGFNATGMVVNGQVKDMTDLNDNFTDQRRIYGNFTQIQLDDANAIVIAYKLTR